MERRARRRTQKGTKRSRRTDRQSVVDRKKGTVKGETETETRGDTEKPSSNSLLRWPLPLASSRPVITWPSPPPQHLVNCLVLNIMVLLPAQRERKGEEEGARLVGARDICGHSLGSLGTYPSACCVAAFEGKCLTDCLAG